MLGRREVTAGRRLSASHSSLGTDCGEDSQERAVRERERERVRMTEVKRQNVREVNLKSIFVSLCLFMGLILS